MIHLTSSSTLLTYTPRLEAVFNRRRSVPGLTEFISLLGSSWAAASNRAIVLASTGFPRSSVTHRRASSSSAASDDGDTDSADAAGTGSGACPDCDGGADCAD